MINKSLILEVIILGKKYNQYNKNKEENTEAAVIEEPIQVPDGEQVNVDISEEEIEDIKTLEESPTSDDIKSDILQEAMKGTDTEIKEYLGIEEKSEKKKEEKKETPKVEKYAVEKEISDLEERLKKSRSEIDKAEIWGQIQELRKQTEKLADIKMVNIEDAPNITNHKNNFSARGSITNTGNTFISNI